MPLPAWIRRVAPLLWYVGLAIAVTWPLASDPFGRLGALSGTGDPYLNLWILGWDLRTFQHAPLDVLTGRIFDAAIFHPARQTLAYSDHLIVVAALVWPLYAMTGSLSFAYNAVLIGSLLGSALAMHALARRISGSTAAALTAGTIWGYWPYHTAHLGHLQLQALYAMPLAWLALHRLVAGRRLRDAVALGVAAAFMAATSVYYGVIGGLGLVVSAVALLAGTGGRRAGRVLTRLALAAAIGALLVAPFVVPYWQAQQREGFARNVYEAARHAATPGSYVSAPGVNAVYGATGWLRTERGVESELFIGFVAIALAFIGVCTSRRFGHWPAALSAAALVVTGFVLSLGPDGWRALYVGLHGSVFGFQAIRAPARFGVLVAFGVAILAALGMKAIERRARSPCAAVDLPSRVLAWPCLVLLVLVAVEYLNRPLPLVAAPRTSTPVGLWLRDALGQGAVLHLPLGGDIENTPVMVESLEHGRRLVNGYSGQRPAFFSGLVDTMHGFPSAEAMWTLKDLDVRFVVSPVRVDTSAWPLVERAALTDSAGLEPRFIYELAWSDDAERRLGPPSTPVPPEPGPVPFALGERLTYQVRWAGPAGTVDAGTVSLAVESPDPASASDPSAAYRFVLAAKTAPWIARFFEADDRFETTTDAKLLPLRHERHLREGRRVVDQVIAYDTASGLMHMRDAAGESVGPPIRLWPHARDGLAAFAYARTLALEPGSEVELPIVENGRHSTLLLKPVRVEMITAGGRASPALRIEAVLRQRVQRRSAPEITLWQGRGRTRPLLAAEVRAVFGNLRIELDARHDGS